MKTKNSLSNKTHNVITLNTLIEIFAVVEVTALTNTVNLADNGGAFCSVTGASCTEGQRKIGQEVGCTEGDICYARSGQVLTVL